MRRYILQANHEELVWLSTLLLFTILLILIWGLRYSLEKMGQQSKAGIGFKIED